MCFLYLVFFCIGFGGYAIFENIKIKPSTKFDETVRILFDHYTAFGIMIIWEIMVLGNIPKLSLEMPNFWSEFFSISMLLFMILLPFYRLFLVEIFCDSKTIKDNIIVIGAVLLMMVSAIAPLFFH